MKLPMPPSRVQKVSYVSAPAIDFEQLAIAQCNDAKLSELRFGSNSLKVRDVSLPGSGNLLTSYTSTLPWHHTPSISPVAT